MRPQTDSNSYAAGQAVAEGRRFATLAADALLLRGAGAGAGLERRRELSAACVGIQVSHAAAACCMQAPHAAYTGPARAQRRSWWQQAVTGKLCCLHLPCVLFRHGVSRRRGTPGQARPHLAPIDMAGKV